MTVAKTMMRILFACAIFFGVAANCFARLEFSPEDRVLILAPHPDDEAIAAAGIIQHARACGAKLKVAYLTNGDYNEFSYLFYKKIPVFSKAGFIEIGKTRASEAKNAMAFFGLAPTDLAYLGYPDRFTETILTGFWNPKYPLNSLLTRISRVPYKDALSPGAPYTGESILKDLKSVLADFKPTKIFVSSPQDTNPDHRSFYVYLRVALWDLEKTIPKPAVYPYLVHRVGWPNPRKYMPQTGLEPPVDLMTGDIAWEEVPLKPGEVEKKRRAISLYKSQMSFAQTYFLSFVRSNELLCFYPFVDLQKGSYKRSLKIDSRLVSEINYNKDDEFLYINIELNKEVAQEIKADIYLMGYRYDKDFASMPKIFFKAKGSVMFVYDKRKRIDVKGARLSASGHTLVIRFPLSELKQPQYIFSRIILKGRIFAVHVAPWVILKL
ncbi:MAG: PIG-L family deacetylase [Candidatus Omnitrophota bacterium]